MKKSIFLIALFTILFTFSTIHVFAKEKRVIVKGTWSNDRIRTLFPACPVVYINDDVLSIYLADPLTDLEVVITDSNGTIVYQGSISSTQPGYTYSITLPEDTEGVYTITMSHRRYGLLTGWF